MSTDFVPSRLTDMTDSEFGECTPAEYAARASNDDERSEDARHAQELEEAAYRPEWCIRWFAYAVVFWTVVLAVFA